MQDFYSQATTGIESDITKAERFAVEENLEANPIEDSGSKQVEAVAKESLVGAALFRNLDKAADNVVEQEGWELDDETRQDINKNYNERESKYLRESNSEEAFIKRQADIEYEREMDGTLARMGVVKSMGSIMAMSLLDPVTWTSLGSTYVLTAAKQASRAKKILLASGVLGAENAAIESAFYAANTQADPSNILIAAGLGSVVGGGVGWLAREKKPNLAAHADEADSAVRADIESFVLREVEEEVEKATGRVRSDIAEAVGPDGDALKVQGDMRDMEARLKGEMELSLKPHEVDSILDELAFIEARRVEIDKVTNVDPAKTSTPTKDMLDDLNAETRELDAKARELEAKLDGHTRATDAAAYKKKWKKWSTKKKIDRLYEGKGAPNKRLVAASQREAAVKAEKQAIADLKPDARETLIKEARQDPAIAAKLDAELKSVESLKVKAKQEIEDLYGCEVIL